MSRKVHHIVIIFNIVCYCIGFNSILYVYLILLYCLTCITVFSIQHAPCNQHTRTSYIGP